MARLIPIVALSVAGCAARVADDSVAVEDAAERMAVADCARRVRCAPVPFSRQFASVAQCERATGAQLAMMLKSPRANLTPQWAVSCADALTADPCSEQVPRVCWTTPGKGAEGAPCSSGADCASRLCLGESPDDDCRDGVCTAREYAKYGERCGVFPGGRVVHCAAQGVCSDRDGHGEMGTCLPPAEEGHACNVDVGPGCLWPSRCIAGVCGAAAGACSAPSAP